MEYTSAGVILINMNSKVLIVQYPEGHWGFPKGYKETEDKSLVDTAKRELKEEIDISPNFFLDTNRYQFNESYGKKKIMGTSNNTNRASRASNLSLIYSLFLVNFCL
ncbi:NUDIX domain-containing protein [Streptococcus thermophilus]|uniref:NUDIX domain-containing protein n=1 Tax=Streptococcus thermophilus TaxID=1308 RepID=UPI0022EA91FE|nr:NUDIX domain-containing protein [Streptococcus thermophilus]MDA3766751.1 NUDIX domain-containing protein [Streptococcus thermophilus]MDA3774080.1 NUDIX domain-containing protein [Streptococcus thermophilus]